MISRQQLQYSLIPKQVSETVRRIKTSLQPTKFCSVTLDIWSSKCMHAYLGVTCHILIEWKMVSYLLACKQILGPHTAENILANFEEILDEFDVRAKVFKVVTDNTSNMKKAFTVSLPGFSLSDSDESHKVKMRITVLTLKRVQKAVKTTMTLILIQYQNESVALLIHFNSVLRTVLMCHQSNH